MAPTTSSGGGSSGKGNGKSKKRARGGGGGALESGGQRDYQSLLWLLLLDAETRAAMAGEAVEEVEVLKVSQWVGGGACVWCVEGVGLGCSLCSTHSRTCDKNKHPSPNQTTNEKPKQEHLKGIAHLAGVHEWLMDLLVFQASLRQHDPGATVQPEAGLHFVLQVGR